MEDIALSCEGVMKCYAIQAGRELRVMVDAASITDEVAGALAFEIATKIERKLQYPGQVKVTVIRETRATSYAK
jgi:ribonuclease Y